MSLRAVASKIGWPLLGVGLGYVATLGVSHPAPAAMAVAEVVTPSAATPDRPDSAAARADKARLDALAARLALLEARSEPIADDEPEDAPDMEADQHAASREYWQDLLTGVEREAPTQWSEGATRSLTNDLTNQAGTHGLSVVDLTCRATKCRATLAWNDDRDGHEVVARLAHEPYALNCARSVRLDEASEEGGARRRATLILDCANQAP